MALIKVFSVILILGQKLFNCAGNAANRFFQETWNIIKRGIDRRVFLANYTYL